MPSYLSVFLIVLAVFALFVVIGTLSIRRRLHSLGGLRSFFEENFGPYPQELIKREGLHRLLAKDPGFDESNMIVLVTSVISQYQWAIENRDWRALRIFMDEPLFWQNHRLICELIRKKEKIVIEQAMIPMVTIESFAERGGREYLKIQLNTNIRCRRIDERSGKQLAGGKLPSGSTIYHLTFSRPLGKKTHRRDEVSITRCPECNSTLSVRADGTCAFCRKEIGKLDRGWILSDLSESVKKSMPVASETSMTEEKSQLKHF